MTYKQCLLNEKFLRNFLAYFQHISKIAFKVIIYALKNEHHNYTYYQMDFRLRDGSVKIEIFNKIIPLKTAQLRYLKITKLIEYIQCISFHLRKGHLHNYPRTI